MGSLYEFLLWVRLIRLPNELGFMNLGDERKRTDQMFFNFVTLTDAGIQNARHFAGTGIVATMAMAN